MFVKRAGGLPQWAGSPRYASDRNPLISLITRAEITNGYFRDIHSFWEPMQRAVRCLTHPHSHWCIGSYGGHLAISIHSFQSSELFLIPFFVCNLSRSAMDWVESRSFHVCVKSQKYFCNGHSASIYSLRILSMIPFMACFRARAPSSGIKCKEEELAPSMVRARFLDLLQACSALWPFIQRSLPAAGQSAVTKSQTHKVSSSCHLHIVPAHHVPTAEGLQHCVEKCQRNCCHETREQSQWAKCSMPEKSFRRTKIEGHGDLLLLRPMKTSNQSDENVRNTKRSSIRSYDNSLLPNFYLKYEQL